MIGRGETAARFTVPDVVHLVVA